MTKIEEVLPGLTREELHQGHIIAYSVLQSTREVVSAWYERCLHDIETWDPARPLLLLQDMSRVILTPFARTKAGELAKVRDDLSGRTGVVIAASTMGHLTRLFVDRTLQQTRQRRVFFSREDALAWLEEML